MTADLRLIPVESRPFNAETPLQALAEPLTPTVLWYVRNHFDVPRIDPGTWRLTVDGAVRRPLTLSLADLPHLPHRTIAATLECAGNGRALMTPTPPGTPWRLGAVSTGTFTGVPLLEILDRAGLDPGVLEIICEGADRGEVAPGRTESFVRALPVDVARHPDTLLAWSMNASPLSPEHGYPARLVVPRWYGMASVKWLVGIRASTRAFTGYFQTERYVYVTQTSDGVEPVTLMRPRAVIASPQDGAVIRKGPVEIAGSAWSGRGPIRLVEVSTDGGASSSPAVLGRPASDHAATPWRFQWTAPGPGPYVIQARASDAAAGRQPEAPVWNTHGYGNNTVHTVRVSVS